MQCHCYCACDYCAVDCSLSAALATNSINAYLLTYLLTYLLKINNKNDITTPSTSEAAGNNDVTYPDVNVRSDVSLSLEHFGRRVRRRATPRGQLLARSEIVAETKVYRQRIDIPPAYQHRLTLISTELAQAYLCNG